MRSIPSSHRSFPNVAFETVPTVIKILGSVQLEARVGAHFMLWCCCCYSVYLSGWSGQDKKQQQQKQRQQNNNK